MLNDNATAHKDADDSTVDKQSQLVVVAVPGSSDRVIVEAERTEHTPSKTLVWLVESESDIIDLMVRENVIDARTDAGRDVVEDALTGGVKTRTRPERR